jgi:hypothetical protein
MPRIMHCRTLAAGIVVLLAALLAQTAMAEPLLTKSHRVVWWYHPAFAPDVYAGHRRVGAILEEIEASPYYRQFGGDEDTHSAWAFTGPNQRRYFGGRGWQPEWVASPR